MKIKVCGMRDSNNIFELIKLKPDFVGFIFYKKSKRYIVDFPQIKFPKNIKKVGVFVNESIKEIFKKRKLYQLDCIQLHGNESYQYCKELRNSELVSEDFEIIKAFSVDENFNFDVTKPYEKVVDYFLFDTKGKDYGGNGIKFNWEILQEYKGDIPFLLSGGITKEDVIKIKNIKHYAFEGIDVNSGFEFEPGLKNIDDIKEFKYKL
ncbi:MAG: N-(5'-phosphoribosyl)anthranilate isomerase [Lutibacter sp.]|nr:MAG: N-(5'-phosphoribosyl)anthranilate isomerase [Lutibacter sp.]